MALIFALSALVSATTGPRIGIAFLAFAVLISGLYFNSLGVLPWQDAQATALDKIERMRSIAKVEYAYETSIEDGRITNWEALKIKDIYQESKNRKS